MFFIVESHDSTSSGTTERQARHFVLELNEARSQVEYRTWVGGRIVGLFRSLARDYCPDGSEKADIVERLVEVGRKASRRGASMIGAACEPGYGDDGGRRVELVAKFQ